MALNLETAYKTILAAAKQRRFLAYGDLATAQEVDWVTKRNQIFTQLSTLIGIAYDKNWPLFTSIVVAQPHTEDGLLEGPSFAGFIGDVKKKGVVVDDPLAFLRAEQGRVFDWALDAPETLDLEVGGPKFIQFFSPVVDALRALGGSASPKEVGSWIATEGKFPEGELERQTKTGRPSFANRIAWARFYLTKAGYLDSSARGRWSLTDLGRESNLSPEAALTLFKEVRRKEGYGTVVDDEPAPETPPSRDLGPLSDPNIQFWFAGAVWDRNSDQTDRFLADLGKTVRRSGNRRA